MRKLVTVRRVSAVHPIPGADAIECATVDGWSVVASKGQFAAGDACVYFEIDCVLPVRPEFEFLRSRCYVKRDWVEGMRLRTSKFRGQISQGLVMEPAKLGIDPNTPSDVDLAEVLGVVKWDPPVPAELGGAVRGHMPSFIRKTDQERCQNLGDAIFGENADASWEVSIKLDGTSMTVYQNGSDMGVAGRNYDFALDVPNPNAFIQVTKAMQLHYAIAILNRNVAIQGELMGPNIQGNREALKRATFFVFDIFDIDKQCYFSPKERCEFVRSIRSVQSKLGVPEDDWLRHVPVIHECVTLDFLGLKSVTDLLAYAEGPSMNEAVTREGLVFKRCDGGFSFKAISNKFLLSQKD